jgi:hypothetical protein
MGLESVGDVEVMSKRPLSAGRYAPAAVLPPYAYVPGHGQPHPVNDPEGHLYVPQTKGHEPANAAAVHAEVRTTPALERGSLAATLAADPQWLYALDLFNGGFYWESHEAWEGFWIALGRNTQEAQCVQGLIRLAAACVKIREGKPVGVRRHLKRARELLGDIKAAPVGSAEGRPTPSTAALGLDVGSVAAVVRELEEYSPQCWHTSKTPVVRVLAENLSVAAYRAAGVGD